MGDLRRAWAVVWKDLLTERRSKAAFNAMAFFAAMVLFIFSFALGPDAPGMAAGGQTLLQYLWPGLLWVAIFFTGILALGRSFQIEMESGGLEALRLYPGDKKALFAGKLIANLAVLAVMELLLIPLSAILYNVDVWPKLPGILGVILLGSVGFAAVGTFYAALTANLRARDVMLPVLLFPILVPVVVAAVKATTLVIRGDPMGEMWAWLRILGLIDVV
ncbi:MAG: transcriptional regulator, partial [Gemmatimonadetes bacterium]|nr:transcriptional regulator [Gemmatimonadota bacterium]NIS00703.1 transcriptional regulator [Gemmatimonadota bacterium]NIT66280.1 transcriptional regulator [Gemmatimonadota bacterium]NIU54825.1 transcriptional regulator [Gemmatimonadota bacterium]NIV22836.1 transcriptional regulator [Gemmatimonadota bacterium]